MKSRSIKEDLIIFYKNCSPKELMKIKETLPNNIGCSIHCEGKLYEPARCTATFVNNTGDYCRIAFRQQGGDYFLIEYNNQRPFEIDCGELERCIPETLEEIKCNFSYVFEVINKIADNYVAKDDKTEMCKVEFTLGFLRKTFSDLPDDTQIGINSIFISPDSCEPSNISEVHYDKNTGKILITPEIISLYDEEFENI